MPSRWPASIITKNSVTPTGPVATGSAPGIWRLDEVAYWSKQGLWPNASISPDPYYSYVPMLLATTSLNGGQNKTFLDSSTNNFTVTRNGNTTQGSFNPYGSLWSNYFDGSGDYLQTSGANLALGSGAWTIEGWIYLISYPGSYAQIYDSRFDSHGTTAGLTLYVGSTGTLRVYQGTDRAYTSATISRNTWTHFAAVYDGTTLKLYLNGSNTGATNYTTSFNLTNTTMQIAAEWTTTAGFINAYISNFRIVKGTAVYTSNFTPPTTNLTAISGTSLLTCQSNRFRDASSNNYAITAYGDTRVTDFAPFSPAYPGYSPSAGISSVYFDGSTDWLNLGGQSAFAYGTGAFTIECWFYAFGLGQMIIDGRPAFTNGNYVLVSVGGGGTLEYYSNNVGQVLGNTQVPLRAWNHFAIARSGTTTKMFLNGIENASFTDNTNYEAATDRPIIGTNGYRTDLSHFNGYMSNFRIVKGTAVYTTAFTPPTSPVTAISGTSLLLNASNFNIYDATTTNNMETFGNTQVSTAVSKFGGSSMYFDGNGDYLVTYKALNLRMGSGNMTIECWIYPTSKTGWLGIFSKGNVNQFEYSLGWEDSVLTARLADNQSFEVSSTNVNLNAWNHVAYVRNGTTFTVYINGIAEGTTTSSTSFVTTQYNEVFLVGYYDFIGNQAYFQGYIDDLRITKGVARYTSNFTPPTQAFPTY